MGDVVLAREQATERVVAMKFLRGPATPGSFDRFLIEVKALARLDHPNIVRVLSPDFLRADPYFTMEYAAGGALSERVKRAGPLPPIEAARLISAVARAIHAAHGADVLHRDLKPSNILQMADGTPKVSDFGLGKLTDRQEDLTRTGPLGTPSFMPPEQISRKHGEIGPRSDVYALGASLYYLVTGLPPFTGISSDEILRKVETEPPARPRRHRPNLSLELEGIILKCLEKRPHLRYGSAAALAEDLDRFLAGQNPLAPPWTRWRRLRRTVARNRAELGAIAGLACIILLTFAIGTMWKGDELDPVLPRPLPRGPLPVAIVKVWDRPGAAGRPVGDPGKLHEEIRDHLAQRKAFHLVTADEVRIPLGWVLGKGTYETAQPGAPLRISARDEAIALLIPDPGVDRYRLRASIRQDRLANEVDHTLPPGMSRAGLVIGHASVPIDSNWSAHVLTGIQFSDFDPAGLPGVVPPDNRVTVQAIVYAQAPLVPLRSTLVPLGRLPLAPAVPDARDWQDFIVDVGTDGIRIQHDRRETWIATVSLREGWAACRTESKQWFGGTEPSLPDWDPRLPIGIRIRGCCVSIRDVTIERIH
jgi:serine/threonine-protein kinase